MKSVYLICLASLVLLGGCTSLTQKANTEASRALARQGDYDLLGAKQYGDDVVCGAYRVVGRWGEPGQVSRFIYVNEQVNLVTSATDVAIFCSDSPIEALDQRFGIRLSEGNRARYEQLAHDMVHLGNTLERFYDEQYRYPSNDQGLEALLAAPTVPPRLRNYPEGGYLDALPLDPWGKPYKYRAPDFAGAKTPFTLWSEGADQAPGGRGENADVYLSMIPYLEYAASAR